MYKQLGRDSVGKRCQDVGDIRYKFVVGQFQLLIFPFIIVFFQDIVVSPVGSM